MRARTLKLITLTTVLFALAFNTFGQVTATATATATILTPIAIVRVNNMSFGNIAINASAGTVLLPAAASPTRIPGGGVTLPTPAGTVTSASFTVSGQVNATYSISLPASATLINGAFTMTANAFVSSPTVAAGGNLGATGSQTLYVGATLNVNASQAGGTYTSAAFSVTVNYN